MYKNEGWLLINVQPLQILRPLSQKTVIEKFIFFFQYTITSDLWKNVFDRILKIKIKLHIYYYSKNFREQNKLIFYGQQDLP